MGEIKDKVQGKAREVKGAATGDAGTEMKGKAQQAKGNVEGKMNEAGDRAQGTASSAKTDARETRDRA